MTFQSRVNRQKQNPYKKPFVWLVIFASVFSHFQLIVVSAEDIVAPVVTEVVTTTSETPAPSVSEPLSEEVTPVEPTEVPSETTPEVVPPAQTWDSSPLPEIPVTTWGESTTIELITGDNAIPFTGTSSSWTQGAGGTVGIEESPLSAASGANTVLPPKTVLIQDGTISINDEESSATLKKDDQLKIREIQLEETAIVTGAAGVTVIIPEDTKIFSPEEVKTEPVVNEVPVIETGENFMTTGSEVLSTADITTGENIISDSGVTAELIESSFLWAVTNEQTVAPTDAFLGQAPLQSDNLVIENNTTDQVEWIGTGTVTERTFSFGMDDQHLVFTKPVEIHIATPNLIDGTLVMVRVKHAGDRGFSMQGIATNAGLTCDNKGNITSESDTTVVKNGEVIFYTCGASAFALGVLDAMNPWVGASYIAVQQSDGAIIVGGWGMNYGGTVRNGLARITTTGLLDPGYNPNLEWGVINGIAIQADGKVIAGGTFTTVWGVGQARVARITTTGILDSSWRVTVDNTVVAVFVQPSDQAILVGGSFTTVSGMNTTAVTRNRVVRFSSSGYVESFNPNVNSFVSALAVQSDGKVIIGGYFFSAIGSTTLNRLWRVTTTWLADSTWKPDPDGIITSLAVQSDDATIFWGAFTTVSGATITRNRIARITSTGLIDSKFNPNAGGQVQALAVQSDGKIYVWGALFSTIGARPISNFARLNKDGSVDTTFIATVNSSVNAIAIDTFNTAVVLGGNFTTVRGIAKNGIARLGTIESICGWFEGCSSWFNANTGVVYTSTGLVSSWRSHSVYDNFSGMQNTGSLMPTYVTGNAMNYNSIVRFTSGNYMLVSWQYFNQFDNSLFVVFRTPHNSGALVARPSTLVLAPAACDAAMVLSGGRLTTQLSGQTITSTMNVNSNSPQIASLMYGTGFGQALFLSGVSNATGTTTGVKAVLNPTSGLIIGNIGSNCVANGAFSGDIAEIITFNRRLDISEANMVNSYLALKYAITLDQTTGHDYTLSGGLTAWSRLSGWVYNKDIAGVWRNDASSLLQYTGKSSNNSGDIQVTFTWTFTNNTTLVWWNDGGATGTLVTGDANNAPATYKRIPRTWKFQEKNGDLGAVVVSYFTWNTLSAGTGELFMFVNTWGTSLSGSFTTRYTGSLANGIWEFPPVNFVDGALMTFGFFDVAPAGTITIEAPTWFAYTGTYVPSFLTQSATKYFAQSTSDRFRVVDTLGTDPGYTTTIQIAGDLTTWSLSIASWNVQFKVSSTWVDLVDGTSNPRVVIDNGAINYQSLNTARTFIYRATAANSSVVGTYGAYIRLNTDMPGGQYAWAYSGVIVFTLIPN